jgi:Na+/H+ antiporter NhaD/arsenite permease-like protein
VRASGGDPLRLLVLLCLVTAVLSAFLDNVTTVVLMTPVTLSIAARLGVSPMPYLISQILASNIGGTATLIGDPPNIIIGSEAGLDFSAFLLNLGPVTVIVFVVFLLTAVVLFRGTLKTPSARREEALERTEESLITNPALLARALLVLALVIVGFLVHGALGLEAATIAMLGATALLLIGGLDVHKALATVEWSTLFFFVGLFILVEGVVHVGIVSGVADWIANAVAGDTGVASMALLWVSAGGSAVIDNIPYTATAVPVVQRLVADGMAPDALWWALALGACLGGNLTIVGASANVVVANLAGQAGHPIRFLQFFRYGAIVVVESLLISSVYVWWRYVS